MSQMVTRQKADQDEKEKRQTDSPVKDMKKKMAANAEKEKNAAEKPVEKNTEKPADKSVDKPSDKVEKPKPADKADKPAEKKADKPADRKSDAQNEKKKEDGGKGESSGKPEKPDPKKPETRERPQQNGGSNGVNGTVSGGSSSDELVIDDHDEIDENDEIFPELAYDDSDVEWEPAVEACPSRSLTRRSQVKNTRTPETPRPASDKQPEPQDESKDAKALKLVQESGKTSDSPKPEAKKSESKKPDTQKPDPKESQKESKKAAEAKESPKKDKEVAKKDGKEAKESPKKDKEVAKKDEKEAREAPKKDKDTKKDGKEGTEKEEGKEKKSDKVEVEVVVEIESTSETSEESRKPDTNYSKSRVKVSPYRRSVRLADQTASSLAANYTGNNTTMEMDITESSSLMEESLNDSYLSGLRSIKGRRSYKPLKEMTLRNVSVNRSVRSNTSTIASDLSSRPTGTVVGRKRKPDGDDVISLASEAEEIPVAGKRQRLIDRLARPFRRTALLNARSNAEIVGINTDLPLSAPVASTTSFDPESLKPGPEAPLAPAPGPVHVAPEDSKRCIVM